MTSLIATSWPSRAIGDSIGVDTTSKLPYHKIRNMNLGEFLRKNRYLVLTIILAIIVVFLYFLTVSLHSPNINFPSLRKTQTAVPAVPSAAVNVKNPVLASFSQNPNYTVSTLDGPGALKYFKDYGVFGKTYNAKVQTGVLPVTKAFVILSPNKNQVVDYKDSAGNILFSYSIGFSGDTMSIYIYLPDEKLKSADASMLFSSAAVYAVSKLNATGKIETTPLPDLGGHKLFGVAPVIIPAGQTQIPTPTPTPTNPTK